MPDDFERRLDDRNRPPGVDPRARWEIGVFHRPYVTLTYLDADREKLQTMIGLVRERGLPEGVDQDDLPDEGRRSGSPART